MRTALWLCRRVMPTETRVTSRSSSLLLSRTFASSETPVNPPDAASSRPSVDSVGPSLAASAALSEMRKSTPTGRLLDLFGPPKDDDPHPGTPKGPKSETPTSMYQTKDMVQIILQAVENCKPSLKVQGIKMGTKLQYFPKFVTPNESRSLAIRWLIEATMKRKKSSNAKLAECLALELLLAYKKEGSARQKREDLHKLALENKGNIGGNLRQGTKRKEKPK